ncbi:MAG: hypothetical protein ABIP51_02105 [Bacteroidia bacterium]
MLKKDYLGRQFEEFGKVMAVILGFKKLQDWDKFEKEIADASKKFTSLEINHLESFTNEGFEKEILTHPTLTQAQKKILADLLFEKLNFYAAQNNETNYQKLKEKCLSIYTHIQNDQTENEFDMNVHYKLEILKR